MRVLAVDTSTAAVTVGLVELTADGTRPLAQRCTVAPRGHAELLAPQLRAVLDAGSPDALVCGVGPGAFTGLRAGIATAAAYGHATGLPVYPVCGLDAMAVTAAGDAACDPVLVSVDARRGELYWAVYSGGGRLAGPAVGPPDVVAAAAAEHGVGAVAGDGARLEHLAGPRRVPPEYPGPAGLVAVAAGELLAGAPPGELAPLYLRRPDAQQPGARKRVTP